MLRVSLLVASLLAFAGCTRMDASGLDREFESFRYEQEMVRGRELEELYRLELKRSEDLTVGILALREEVRRKEEEVSRLRARLLELDAEAAASAVPGP